MANSSNINERQSDSRLLPFTVAATICFVIAFVLGAGGWYLFGTNRHPAPEKNPITVQTSEQNTAVENSNLAVSSASTSNQSAITTPEIKKAPAGEIAVDGGIVTLGGGDTNLPVSRKSVDAYFIGETGVTNAQYAEFIEAAKHKAPTNWKDNKFPTNEAEMPVINVTWADANDYCEWLSKNLGATVRLPSEAEWELAARGNTGFKYPWGNDWNDEAAANRETNGKVHPVKNFPKGRSPLGVYDMVGNVWEWTSDLFADELGNPIFRVGEKAKQRVIKGGSVKDKRDYLKITLREGRPENRESELIGFRYVISRK